MADNLPGLDIHPYDDKAFRVTVAVLLSSSACLLLSSVLNGFTRSHTTELEEEDAESNAPLLSFHSVYTPRASRRLASLGGLSLPLLGRIFTESSFVLNGVSGSVRGGESLALLGPSGSGKSTLLSFLAGDQQGGGESGGSLSSRGCVRLRGRTVSAAFRRSRFAFVAQADELPSHLTAFEAVCFSAACRLPPATAASFALAAERALAQVGLESSGAARVSALSGGQRRRVSIAQELVTQPAVIILDEPTRCVLRWAGTAHSLMTPGRRVRSLQRAGRLPRPLARARPRRPLPREWRARRRRRLRALPVQRGVPHLRLRAAAQRWRTHALGRPHARRRGRRWPTGCAFQRLRLRLPARPQPSGARAVLRH